MKRFIATALVLCFTAWAPSARAQEPKPFVPDKTAPAAKPDEAPAPAAKADKAAPGPLPAAVSPATPARAKTAPVVVPEPIPSPAKSAPVVVPEPIPGRAKSAPVVVPEPIPARAKSPPVVVPEPMPQAMPAPIVTPHAAMTCPPAGAPPCAANANCCNAPTCACAPCDCGPCRTRGTCGDCGTCDNGCCAVAADDQVWHLLPQTELLRISGWVDGGFLTNGGNPPSHFNGPYNSDFRDEAQLNQLYVIMEKPFDKCADWDVGGRVDLLYGSDYFQAQSKGWENNRNGSARWNDGNFNGLAIPQLYGAVGNDQLSVKVGHFYTVVGYEGVPAIGDFFYTRSYAYQFAGPFTHWGALATYKPENALTINAGLVNGWDALDRVGNGLSFLGSASLAFSDDVKLTVGVITGNELNAAGTDSANRTRYDVTLDVHVAKDLEWVLEHNYAVQQNGDSRGQTSWYGLGSYLYYTLNPCWKAGLRYEWFRDQDGTRVAGAFAGDPNTGAYAGSFQAITLGANWTPMANVCIRPQVQWDWFGGNGLPFDDRTAANQFLAGLDAILQF